jgi:hypothetical protein
MGLGFRDIQYYVVIPSVVHWSSTSGKLEIHTPTGGETGNTHAHWGRRSFSPSGRVYEQC